MKNLRKIFFTILLLSGGWSFAQDYVFDPGFAGDGSMTGAPFSGPVQILFHEGKYLTIGLEKIGQVNYDGTVNTAFGANGYVDYYATWGDKLAIKGAKIINNYLVTYGVMRNNSPSETNDIFVSRIDLSNGQPDSGFGNNGTKIIDFGEEESATDIHLLEDGTILLLGTKMTSSDLFVLLSRLTANGEIDTGFAASGYKTMISQASGGQFFTLDDKIMLTATVRQEPFSPNWDYLLAQITTDGNLVGTFGDNGIKRIPLPVSFPYTITPEAAQIKNGQLYASYRNSTYSNHVMKYDLATEQVVYDGAISNIASFSISADEEIYYTEYSSIPSYNFTLKRLTDSGEPDSSFNNGSGLYTYTLLPFPPAETMALSTFLHDDGRIVIGGWSRYPTGNLNMAMIRIGDPSLFLGTQSMDHVPFTVFPNPVSDQLHISNPGQLAIEKLEVFDLTGKKLLTAPNQSQLDVAHLSAGMYLLSVTASGNNFSVKFIKS